MVGLTLEGGKQLDAALDELKYTTARAVARRAMKKALEPVAQTARALVAKRSGRLASSITVVPRVKKSQRAIARRDKSSDTRVMYVGPSGYNGALGYLVEWGSGPRHHKDGKYSGIMPAQPFLRPAWDAHRTLVLALLQEQLRVAIDKAAARARKKALKAGAK